MMLSIIPQEAQHLLFDDDETSSSFGGESHPVAPVSAAVSYFYHYQSLGRTHEGHRSHFLEC